MSGRGFPARAARATQDERVLKAVAKTAQLLLEKRKAAIGGLGDFEERRTRAREIKERVVANLDSLAQTFAQNATAAGAKVHFAQSGREVGALLVKLARERNLKLAVKTKSMTTEEIGFEELAHAAGIEAVETDLGEFIIQLAHEKPSHIMAPAIHRDRAQVGQLFHEKLGVPADLGVEGLVAAARNHLREIFLNADLGITGGNFLVAETGTVALVTNEGNGRMTTSLPRLQFVVAGIDKLIPTLADLPEFLTLLTRSASGQPISSYVTMVTGPRKQGETDGPEEVHIVLLDNGRSTIAAGPFWQMLYCLHCGACLNHCPVYRAVGGHAWSSPYPGPMGSILSPLIWGLDEYPELPDACTLCGRCREACPMAIPLPDYHLKLKEKRNARALLPRLGATLASKPGLYRFALARLRGVLRKGSVPIETRAYANWTKARALPMPGEGPTFREWWKKRKEGKA